MKEAIIHQTDLEIMIELAKKKKEISVALPLEHSIPEIVEKFNCEPHVFQEILSVRFIK